MTQAQIIQAAVAAALAQVLPQLPKSAGVSRSTKAKARVVRERFNPQEAIDSAVKRRGFKAQGVANENVLTYGKWEAKGFRVKKGEKALKIGSIRLFHVEQVEPITQG